MALAAGQLLTHYEILGPLGAGGMGEVYQAKDTRLEREVAIKVLYRTTERAHRRLWKYAIDADLPLALSARLGDGRERHPDRSRLAGRRADRLHGRGSGRLLADDEERLRRFEREARTLASLNHANLAHVDGIDQVEDTCFIAMELVPGEDPTSPPRAALEEEQAPGHPATVP